MNIMSREEAMALPVEKRPICYRLPERIYTGVWETVGHVSGYWKPRPEGVFDTAEAEKAAMDLCFLIAEEIEKLTANGMSPVDVPTMLVEETAKVTPIGKAAIQCAIQ